MPICGDLNGDGILNVLDIVILVNNILGDGNYNPCGDTNSDDTNNVLDIVVLINIILGDGDTPYACPSDCTSEGPITGCMDDTACNYDTNATEDDGSCEYPDECGICGGSGILEGECDCDNNVLDVCGDCGGGINNCALCCVGLEYDDCLAFPPDTFPTICAEGIVEQGCVWQNDECISDLESPAEEPDID